jgi:hypothetical protein
VSTNVPDSADPTFREWCVVELFGHQRCVGLVTETQIAGAKFVRIEALAKDGVATTRYYGPSAIYCLTPCSEQVARAYAETHGTNPINRFDFARLTATPEEDDDGGCDDGAADADEETEALKPE